MEIQTLRARMSSYRLLRARLWAVVATVTFASIGWSQIAGAHLESIRLIDEGKYVEARENAAAAIRQAPAHAPACELAVLFFDRGVAEQLLALYKEAAATLMRAAELCGGTASAPPRFMTAVLATLGQVHAELGMFTEASRDLRSALQIAKALPAGDERRARVHESLGVLSLRQGFRSQAEHHLRQAIEILRIAPGPSSPDVAAVELTLAGVLLQGSRAPEAAALAREARGRLVATLGVAHPDSIFASVLLAAATAESAPSEAECLLREALAAWLARLPENHLAVMSIWSALGDAQQAQGRIREAVTSSAKALEIARAVTGPDSEQTMRTMYRYAESLKAAKRKKEFTAMLAAAEQIRRSNGYSEPGRYSIDFQALRRRR